MQIPTIICGEKKNYPNGNIIYDYFNQPLAEVSLMPGLGIANSINKQRKHYTELSIHKLIEIIKKAGELLLENDLDDYYEKFTLSTGMPKSVAVDGIESLSNSMKNIETIVDREIPYGSKDSFDSGIITNGNLKHAVSQKGKILGVIAPSNHPLIHISWITALAFKYSIVLKPGKDDPFTPFMVINALLEADLPKSLISMFPVEHSEISKIITYCDKTIFYGNNKSISQFNDSKIIERGSGNSKIYIDLQNSTLDENEILDIAVNSITYHGGRRCSNATSIIINGDSDEFVQKLSKRMKYTLCNPLNSDAVVGCFKDKDEAIALSSYVSQNLHDAQDTTRIHNNNDLVEEADNLFFLNPTVIKCESETSPLYGKELPFPFVTVIERNEHIIDLLSNSLAVSLLTNNEEIIYQCVKEPTISKVIVNASTYSSNCGDPHDGFLFSHLFKIKSYFCTNEILGRGKC